MSEWKPIESAPRDGTLVDRLMKHSAPDPSTGCLNWTGSTRGSSPLRQYGRIAVGSRRDGSRRVERAHRAAYKCFVGPVPDDMCVCHHCDNPRCIRPDHLFLGTKKDNADDRDRKGRNSPPPHTTNEAHKSSKLTDAQVAEIRASPLSSVRLAPAYGVSSGHIRALRRREWRPSPPEQEEKP